MITVRSCLMRSHCAAPRKISCDYLLLMWNMWNGTWKCALCSSGLINKRDLLCGGRAAGEEGGLCISALFAL